MEKILIILAWLAGIGFIISAWTGYFWKWDFSAYYQMVVVFVLLTFSMKICKCCWKGKMMHGHGDMSCPACEGKGGEHTHPHQ